MKPKTKKKVWVGWIEKGVIPFDWYHTGQAKGLSIEGEGIFFYRSRKKDVDNPEYKQMDEDKIRITVEWL